MTNANIHNLAGQQGSGVRDDVKYRYALDENHCVIEISSELVIKGKDYSCISCGRGLRPFKGPIQKHHFRHRAQVDCSPETYLHSLAKLIFLQTYNDCLTNKKPFLVEYMVPINCSACKAHVGKESKKVDLTRHFVNITPETPDRGFIPDLLLTTATGSESLYVEIAVTHFVEESKASSGRRIIEISVGNETDIDLISSCCISEEDSRVTTYNFKKPPLLRTNQHNCPLEISTSSSKQDTPSTPSFFLFKNSGKSLQKNCTKSEYDKLSARSAYSRMLDIPGADSIDDSDFLLRFFVDNIHKAHLAGNNFKNCWLCNFHRRKLDRSNILGTRQWHTYSYSYCHKHKRIIENSNVAVDCKEFWIINNLKPEDDLLMHNQLRAAKYREQQLAKRIAPSPPPPTLPPKQKPEPYPLLEMNAAGFLKTPKVASRKLSGEEIKKILANDTEDPLLDIIFHGVIVNCVSCGSELMLVTSANVNKCSVVIDSWDFVQSGGEFYKSSLLNRILDATACEEDKSLNFVCRCLARYSKSRVLAVQCPSCSEVSPLSSYESGQLFQRKIHHNDYSQIISNKVIFK